MFYEKANGTFNFAKIKNLAAPSFRIGQYLKLCAAIFFDFFHLRVPLAAPVVLFLMLHLIGPAKSDT
jgi:hypothetical protein